MPSFEPTVLLRLQPTHEMAGAMRSIGEGKGRQDLFRERAPEALESLRRIALVESTESASRMEGITLPRAGIERLVIDKADPTPANRPEGEIAGYRNVLGIVHQRHEQLELTPNLLRQLHRELFKLAGGTGAGEWKRTDNLISERRPDGSLFVRFTPTQAWRAPEAVAQLHRDFRSAHDSEIDPLILQALYLLDFLCIHPFSEANGRLAWLLTTLLLYQEGYEIARYISLERLIEQSTATYYDVLYRSSRGWHDDTHDPTPWIEYFLAVLRAAYDELARAVGETWNGRGAKTPIVRQAIERMTGDFTLSELHQRCPTVGWDMLRYGLRSERDAGRIETIGKGPGARWRRRMG